MRRHPLPWWCLLWAVALAVPARADTTITVDGDLSDWPADGFYFLDPPRDTLPWRDIVEIRVTDDNTAGSDGNLYLAFEFRSNFRPSVAGIDIDVYISLDIDGDGQIGGPLDRVIEVTEGTVTDGDGNVVGSIGAMAYDHEFLEVSIPYAVLGLSHGSDVFGIAATTVGWPGLDDQSPDPGIGDDGFIIYDGTQEPEPRAVLLADLAARVSRQGVGLEWSTGSERDNLGFRVLKRQGDKWLPLTRRPIAGLGSSPIGRNYRFRDRDGHPGDAYLIESLDADGSRRTFGPVFAATGQPPVKTVRPRRRARPRLGAQSSRLPPSTRKPAGSGGWRLVADRAGVYRLPPAGGEPYALVRDGVPVPVVELAGRKYFLADPRADRHCDDDVLHLVPGPGLSMSRRRVAGECANPAASAQTTLRRAPPRVYYIAAPGADPFYWAMVWGEQPVTLELALPALVQAPQKLRLTLAGMAAAHVVSVAVNGSELGTIQWQGRSDSTLEISCPPELWREGANSVTLSLPPGADSDLVFVDALEVAYRRRLEADAGALEFAAPPGRCLELAGLAADRTLLLDITDPQDPVRLVGLAAAGDTLRFSDITAGGLQPRRYLAVDTSQVAEAPLAGPWRERDLSRLGGAEVLVLAPEEFAPAASRYCEFQRQAGRSCLWLATAEIYDSLAGGRPGPAAIRALLELARANWQVVPRFVLLLGGATVDPNGYLPDSPPDFVPAHFLRTARRYEAASDAWYVSDAGGKPWAAVGRLAAGDAGQALAAVDKAIAAHQKLAAAAGPVLLVADSYDPADPARPDPSFAEQALRLREQCLVGIDTALLDKAASSDPAAELHAAFTAGQALVVFLGHAYLAGWSSSPVLIDNDSADALDNPTWPLVVSLSCYDGAFTGPWAEALGWHLVANPAGGAAAVLAASSLSEPVALERLAPLLLCSLVGAEGLTLGELWQRWQSGGAKDARLRALLRTYNLLGDPTLPVPRLAP